MQQTVNGILLLDKPFGITSNAALQKVKRLFNAKKAGHTGSLDPIATGMLPICFGEATKFSQFLLESNKTYQVTAKLGITTTTGDNEGAIISTQPVPALTAAQIEAVFAEFTGEIEQIPPMFSAIKHQGQPLYELARKGIEVERLPRRVTIFSLYLDKIVEDVLHFHVHCSKGTYVRTLVEDMGKMLGCGGHVSALSRVSVSPYGNVPMYSLPALQSIFDQSGHEGLMATLHPIETAVQTLPAIKLSASAAFYLRMGQAVRSSFKIDHTFVRLMSENSMFLGIGEVLPDSRIKPLRMLSTMQPCVEHVA